MRVNLGDHTILSFEIINYVLFSSTVFYTYLTCVMWSFVTTKNTDGLPMAKNSVADYDERTRGSGVNDCIYHNSRVLFLSQLFSYKLWSLRLFLFLFQLEIRIVKFPELTNLLIHRKISNIVVFDQFDKYSCLCEKHEKYHVLSMTAIN